MYSLFLVMVTVMSDSSTIFGEIAPARSATHVHYCTELRPQLLASIYSTCRVHVCMCMCMAPCLAHSYTVLVLGGEGGLIEPVCNAISLHQIKKQNNSGSLLNYFHREFGEPNSERFLTAQKNFVQSCAAYCLICYFIRVKDR